MITSLQIQTALFCALVMASSQLSAQVYRWVNERGEIIYSDTMPPTDAKSGHEVLDQKGLEIRRVEPQKTPLQIRIERLEAQKNRALEQQRRLERTRDTALIVTFANVQQIDKLRDERVGLIESAIRVTQTKITKLESKLFGAQNKKQTYLTKNRVIPTQLEDNIAEYQHQHANLVSQIQHNQLRRERTLAQFAQDRVRYLELNELRKSQGRHSEQF